MNKNKGFWVFLTIVILAIVVGMFYNYFPLGDKVSDAEKTCIEEGGTWDDWNGDGARECNYPTTDAGTRCTDSQQCEGRCLGEEEFLLYGSCSEWVDAYGCHNFVEGGLAGAEECL